MSKVDTLTRAQSSLLSKSETVALERLARWIPQSWTPDHLTAIGVFGAALVLAGYTLANTSAIWIWLANLGLVINWFGDSLDGTIARVRKIERPNYGYYLDQTIDTVSSLFVAVGLGLSPFFRLDIVLLVLVSYHMLSIHSFVRAVVTREHSLDMAGLGTTEFRIAIFVTGLLILVLGAQQHELYGIAFSWCDVLALFAVCLMLVLFACFMINESLTQLARDRAARNSKQPPS